MNDRCAAGSGKFLEFLAVTMDLSIEEFAALADKSKNPVQISSICTVFAESELLSLLAEGVPRRDIAAGVHRSITVRVGQMAASLNPQAPVSFTGGAAKNKCLVKEMSRFLKMPVTVPDIPEYTGALGAAITACRGI
jgi:predicted CoA-substrate-specific enzyme activase